MADVPTAEAPPEGEPTAEEILGRPESTLVRDPTASSLKVHEALSNVMGEVQSIAKDRTVAPAQGKNGPRFNFRGVDDVVNAVGPAFRKWGVIPLPRTLSREIRDVTTSGGSKMTSVNVEVEYTFVGPQGDMLTCSSYGEAADSGDKATPKAMSVAYRTALLQALCIPTDEPDPDEHVFEQGGGQARGQRRGQRRGQQGGGGRQQEAPGVISERQAAQIRDAIGALPAEVREETLTAFREEFGVKLASELPRTSYPKAVKWLEEQKRGPLSAPESEEGGSAPGGEARPSGDAEGAQERVIPPSSDPAVAAKAAVACLERREVQQQLASAGLPATGKEPDLRERLTAHWARTGIPASASS